MPEEYTGVESASVAGEQGQPEEQDGANFSSFFEEDSSGVEEQSAVAGQEKKDGEDDQRVEQAFAKRLAQEKEKIRQELEKEYQQRYQQPTYQPQAQPMWQNIEEIAQKMAEEYMITPEVAKQLIAQQQRSEYLERKLLLTEDNIAKTEAKETIEKQRAKNPHLPPFDEQTLLNIRLREYQETGVIPDWKKAYKIYIAENVENGEFSKNIEQQAISQITGRDKANLQVGKAGQPQKRSISDLSDEEFEKMKEAAKRGELKKL